MLNVTNGDSAVAKLRSAGVGGEDALHDGPVGGSAERTRHRRTAALRAGSAGRAIRRGFTAHIAVDPRRTTTSRRYATQTRHRVRRRNRSLPFDAAVLSPRQVEFRDADEIRAAQPEPFDPKPYRKLWRALTAPDQRALNDLHSLPPVVRDAVERLKQEFPWTTDGLNRSQRSLLQGGETEDERPFLGDTIALDYLEGRVHQRAARYDPVTKRLV